MRVLYSQSLSTRATQLDALNKLTCYVFLLDGAGRVRWRACGAPSHDERLALPRLYAQLMDEHRRGAKAAAPSSARFRK